MSLTCVIVDDSADFLRSAARLLDAEGMQVIGRCQNGAEARDVLATASPDVILVDVELGDEDGVEVAASLLELSSQATIILVSSRDQDQLRDTLGADVRYLAKDALSVAAITELLA